MRKLFVISVVGLGLVASPFSPQCLAQPKITLSWASQATNANVLGYLLAWGSKSHVYSATNVYPVAQTSATLSNLQYGVTYYVSMATYGTYNRTSIFSQELTFLTNAPAVIAAAGDSGGSPPMPPSPSGSGKPGGTQPAGGKNNSAANGAGPHSGSGSGPSASGTSSTNITQAQIWGIPPVLATIVSNNLPCLTIDGTVGAIFAVQACDATLSDPSLPSSWITFTNITISNSAPVATNVIPGQPVDAIDLAYVPGIQTVTMPLPPVPGDLMLHRVVMSNDYPILADMVLKPKGYSTRLILINMPGLATPDDCCYVGQAGSFIHYNSSNSVIQLEGSGPTIRQIASTLANHLNMDWTTASEFVYSNGMGQILATVVESDPASSDPIAGTTPSSSIQINF